MSKSVVRDSKFRHVFGKALNKEGWYEGIQSAGISAPDRRVAVAVENITHSHTSRPC
jgi:hypothetical protein